MVKEIEANLCFCIFGTNVKIQNTVAVIFMGMKIFGKLQSSLLRYPVGQKLETSKCPSFLRGRTFSGKFQRVVC